MQVQRFLQSTILNAMRSAPVVIVEGARAVGKTWLLEELRRTGHIAASFSFTDATQREAASVNPLAWLRSLPSPFAIDEAQMLPELPMALKALLDESGENVSCILTGSASISKTGLGGTDPLARRATRLTLEPLTEAELQSTDGRSWSVIDQLFDGIPKTGILDPLPNDWNVQILRGGLPRYRVMGDDRSVRGLYRQIAHDIESILTENVLPGERNDLRVARDVLSHLLMHPGGELNVSAIARSVGIDARTADRYIDILEKRFLVSELANFHRPTKKSARSTAKNYPADIALSAAALATSGRAMTEAGARGGLMEAYVVQQVRAHLGWGSIDANLTHWREIRNGRASEVDLILEDGRGRIVAVEIKSASSITTSHFNGIRSFKKQYGDRFHRGFIIGTGEQVTVFDDDLWVLPMAALSDLAMWEKSADGSEASVRTLDFMEELAMSEVEEAKIFVSYTHQDQQSSIGGDIRKFATDIIDALEGLYGRTARIFLDKNDITWGDNLWNKLDQGLESSTFFMPFVTPRYLKSDACKTEFSRFSEAAQRNNAEQLLLPLIWINPPAFRTDEQSDPIIQRIKSTSYLDVSDARRADPHSAEYVNKVEEVAAQLEKIIAARESVSLSPKTKAETESTDGELEPGLDEFMVEVERLMPLTETAIQEFMNDFVDLGTKFQSETMILQSQSPQQLRATLTLVGNRLAESNKRLSKSASEATRLWDLLMTTLNRAASLSTDIGAHEMTKDVADGLRGIADEIGELDTLELEGIAQQMPKLSSKLVPTSKSILSAVKTLRIMEEAARKWG